jgi:phospholipid/cholesterol/gamma-HCH transport system ATP-binding protein
VIAYRNVHKGFGGRPVLDGFSLDIPEGQTTVLLGYSGSGKSVALKLIVGLLDPDLGEVVVDDAVVHQLDRNGLMALRARVGFVFQFAALFDSMTVGENLALGLRRRGLPAGEIADRSAEALALVGLSGAEARFPSELSGGMRKRVGIARAIVLRPRYILYDEPTTGLDPVTAAVIDQLIVRTRQVYGVTGVVVTHDMRSAYTVGDRIAMLFRGTVRQVGTPDQIRSSHDAVVRQFIEGRPEAAGDAEPAAGAVA